MTKLEILEAYIRNDQRNIRDVTKSYTSETTTYRVIADCALRWFIAKQLCNIDYHHKLVYETLIDLAQDNIYDALVATGLDPEFETQNIINGADKENVCPDCKGEGGWYYHEWEICCKCNGTGKIKQ